MPISEIEIISITPQQLMTTCNQNGGLGRTIEGFKSIGSITDPVLRELWRRAKIAMNEVNQYLVELNKNEQSKS